MLKIAAITVLSIPLLLVGALLSSTWVVVDVRPDDGPRIIVPVPLAVARAALSFAPEEAKRIEIPELEEYADIASEILEELINAPDGVLVEVHDGRDHVLIAKVGDEIEIKVDGDDEQVAIKLPLTVATDILDSYDGDELETHEALAALSSASHTDLIHVRTDEEEVRVWIW